MQLTWLLALGVFSALSKAAPASLAAPEAEISKRSELFYVNFDDTKPDDVKHKIQLQSAWSNSLVLMKTQLDIGFENAIFSHYFNPEDKATVKKVFEAMLGNDPNRGSPTLGVIEVDNDDFAARCIANANLQCYTAQKTLRGTSLVTGAVIHCCMAERTSKVPELSGADAITCGSLGDFVNYGMMSLSSVLLHEFLHFDQIGGENLQDLVGWPKHIGDFGQGPVAPFKDQDDGYGPYSTRSVVNKRFATRNADNYAWLAIENYWTKTCTERAGFTAPRNKADTRPPSFCGGTPENQDTQKCVIQ